VNIAPGALDVTWCVHLHNRSHYDSIGIYLRASEVPSLFFTFHFSLLFPFFPPDPLVSLSYFPSPAFQNYCFHVVRVVE
jgi:hypothetical protein